MSTRQFRVSALFFGLGFPLSARIEVAVVDGDRVEVLDRPLLLDTTMDELELELRDELVRPGVGDVEIELSVFLPARTGRKAQVICTRVMHLPRGRRSRSPFRFDAAYASAKEALPIVEEFLKAMFGKDQGAADRFVNGAAWGKSDAPNPATSSASMSSVEAARVLGVAQPYTRESVTAAFKKAAFDAHPDRNTRADAADKFKRVCEAREVLMRFV